MIPVKDITFELKMQSECDNVLFEILMGNYSTFQDIDLYAKII